MIGMSESNTFAQIWAAIREIRTALTELRAATGTLGAATISKGGLRIADPESGSMIELTEGRIKVWSDYAEAPDIFTTLDATPYSGYENLFRVRLPNAPGTGYSGDGFLFVGSTPTSLSAVSLQAAQISLNAQSNFQLVASGRTYLFANGGIEIITGGSMLLHGLPTTGSAANLRLDPATSSVQYVTSSLRYKNDPQDVVVDPADVLGMTGRTWVDKGTVERLEQAGEDTSTIPRNVGFIAEELDDLPSLRQFVDYDDERRPDAIQYDRLTVALLELAKAQQTQIDALSARLDALEQLA